MGRFRSTRAFELAVFFTCLFVAAPASSHVGSPDVFYEGHAGPYRLFVTVNVPQVIPGIAEVQIRAASGKVNRISTSVSRLTGGGSKYAPVPDTATRSAIDPQLFTSSIWLMEYGSLRLQIKVSGGQGDAEMSVPVASFARKNLVMPPWLGGLLLALTAGLAIGAVSIVGAAAREARLAPGAPVSTAARRSGRIAVTVSAVIVAVIFYLAFAWWNFDARQSAQITKLFKPPPLSITLEQGNRLKLKAADSDWAKYRIMDKLLPDHGHLMHLFLVRTPGFDRFWHLHPVPAADDSFYVNLPPLDAGHYDVLADVVDESGFPWTLVGAVDLPKSTEDGVSADDSGGSFPALNTTLNDSVDVVEDGTRVTWQHGALQANRPLVLHFTIEDPSGKPATDLEPYMGMGAHVEIARSDLSVFSHIHPSGSAPMAAVMLAANTEAGNGQSMPGMTMPDGSKMEMPTKVEPEFSMPYGFPKPGLYRIFLQFKRAGKVETAVFDTQVR